VRPETPLYLRSRPAPQEYRLQWHAQTNDIFLRFNGRINNIVNQPRFASAAKPDETLVHDLSTYKHLIPQRALQHQLPNQALQTWRSEKPELFVKRMDKQPGLDKSRYGR